MFGNTSRSFNTPLWLTAAVLLAMLGFLAPAPVYGQGGCLMAAGPAVPSPLAVGEATTATFTIVAISPNTMNVGDCEFIKVNGGDTIEAVLSCGSGSAGTQPQLCPAPAAIDPGVFSLPAAGSMFTGTAGSACAGINFTISAADPGAVTTGGHVFFTASAPFTLKSVSFGGTPCTFTFPTTVLKEPTKDSQAAPGLQTNQFGFATGTGFSTDGVTSVGSANGTGSSNTTIGQCQAQVDKQVSCDGGMSWQDMGLETANGDGTHGCMVTTPGGNVQFRYQFANADATFAITSCTLTDSNGNVTVPSISSAFPLATMATSSFFTTSPLACTAANFGGTNEPDTARLNCTCSGAPAGFQTAAQVFDTATVTCPSVPSFTSSKTCTPAATPNTFNVGVTVTNTDASGLSTLSCTVTDQTFAGNSGSCPPTLPDGPAVSITPSPLSVGPGPSGTAMGMGTFTSSAAVCNQATVTCTPTVGGMTLAALTAQTPTAQCTPAAGGSIKIKKTFGGNVVAPGATTTVTFTIINTGGIALTGLAFTDAFPLDTTATVASTTSQCNGTANFVVTATGAALTGGSLAVGASCSMSVTLMAAASVTTPTEVCDTTSPVTSDQVTSAPAFACITITTGTTPLGPPDAFQVGYAANLLKGDSFVDLSNSGSLDGTAPGGDICVNVYTFDAAEEMLSCCSCLITPNALASLSVARDLVGSTFTGEKPDSVVIKLVANASDPGLCDPTTPAFQNLTPGLLAWGTTLHNLEIPAGTVTSKFQTTERPFTISPLSPGELAHLTTFCAFIGASGGGGTCNSCQLGAGGAVLGATPQR